MIINTETHNWARHRALHPTRKVVIKPLLLGLGDLLGGRGIGGGWLPGNKHLTETIGLTHM